MTTFESNASLVVAPTFAFDRLERAMAAAGWAREVVHTATPPMLAGEPELAAFRSQRHQVRATYTFNPAVRFRVLALSGSNVEAALEELVEALPVLDLETVRDFLGSDDERLVLVALFAARELRMFMAADRVAPLRAHANPRIAQLAEKALAELTQSAMAEGLRELQALEAKDPSRSILFPFLGERHTRRQVVRWLIHDFKTATPDIARALRAALADEDWEVRASAIIAAVRMGATELGREIGRVAFPETTREGPDRFERDTLAAMQKTALEILGGADVTHAHLRDCMLGVALSPHDRAFLFVYSLSEPLQNEHVETIVHGGVAMMRVEAYDHWLGADDPDITGNPVRRVNPESPFLIARTPLRPCTEAEARELLRSLNMTVPTAEQWEMAMRGTDGRRRPWGDGWEGDPAKLASAWGLTALTRDGEWATEGGSMIVCGADREMRCAWRGRARPGAAFGLRPVMSAG